MFGSHMPTAHESHGRAGRSREAGNYAQIDAFCSMLLLSFLLGGVEDVHERITQS